MTPFAIHHASIFTVGIVGNIISFFVYLAPLPTFYRVYKNKCTGGFHSIPYVAALLSSMLWLYYGFIKTNGMLLITINSVGCIIEAIYIVTYIIFASNKARAFTFKLVFGLNIVFFSSVVLLTHIMVRDTEKRVTILGWISASLSIAVFAAPLSVMAQVIRTKSVEFLPFNLSLSLTCCALTWLCYGLLLKDMCIAIPNILGVLLGIVQMVVYAVFRNSGAKTTMNDNSNKDTKMVVIDVFDAEEKISTHKNNNGDDDRSVKKEIEPHFGEDAV